MTPPVRQAAGNELLSAGAGQAGKALEDYTLALSLLLWFGARAESGSAQTGPRAAAAPLPPFSPHARRVLALHTDKKTGEKDEERLVCVRACSTSRLLPSDAPRLTAW